MNHSSFESAHQPGELDARFSGVVFLGDRSEHAEVRVVALRPHATRRACEPALDADSREFFDWLCGVRGVNSARYRASVVKRRQAACLRAAGCASFVQARQRLERDNEGLDRALSAVLIGVTSFFRDGAPFDALASTLADPRWRKRTELQDELRVLSVGCSDGQELYSVAMLLAEAGLLERSTLCGIDCRQDAVAAGERGVFTKASMDGVPTRLRDRWFTRDGEGYRVAPELRARTRWHVTDAFAFDRPHLFDIILCRNVAIYLRPEFSASLWSSLVSMLTPAGLLMVGKAERPQPLASLLKVGPCLYQLKEALHR